MDRNWFKLVVCSICFLCVVPAFAGDYAIEYSSLDLTGGAQSGVYGGQAMCVSREAAGKIVTSVDYAIHPYLSEPNLVMTSGLDLIEYGGGPHSFGSYLLGSSPITKTFNVFNNGSMDLMLGAPACPPGFSVVEPLASTLTPGTGDNFTIALATDSVGSLSGLVTVSNNDIDYQCFEFSISGLIGLADLVWADFDWSGTERGDEPQPFSTLAKSVNAVNAGGTVSMKAGSTSEHPRITKSMRLQAVGGTVRIGAGS